MQVETSPDPAQALTLVLEASEVPVFRAALERASFMDTRPELQEQVFDFLDQLLRQLPGGGGARE